VANSRPSIERARTATPQQLQHRQLILSDFHPQRVVAVAVANRNERRYVSLRLMPQAPQKQTVRSPRRSRCRVSRDSNGRLRRRQQEIARRGSNAALRKTKAAVSRVGAPSRSATSSMSTTGTTAILERRSKIFALSAWKVASVSRLKIAKILAKT
jgi:hypothetical protein